MKAEVIYLNERVVSDPEICHGKPTIKGTRVMVQGILEFLGAGDSIEEVLEEFPAITREDVLECIASAAHVETWSGAFAEISEIFQPVNTPPQYLNDRIEIVPDVCNGKPVIRGTRIIAQTVLEFLAAGDSLEEVLEEYPDLSREDVLACIDYAARVMGNRFEFYRMA